MTEENKENKNVPIINFTDAAVEKIKQMMAKDGKEGSCIRVAVVTGGCAGLSYEMRFQKNPYENDITFDQGGITILVNAESIAYLSGTEIDYVDTLKESGFQYRNPNASNSCGCGISFS